MQQHAGYEMSIREINHIVYSCLKRDIRFNTIELTGGEASLWKHLEYGYAKFGLIADTITMVTNGNNANRVIGLGMKNWIVSESQATPAQMEQYKPHANRIVFNSHKHKKLPTSPLPNSLPAQCCVSRSPEGVPQLPIEYIRGKVYFCCDCFAHSEYCEMTPDLVCSFEDNFLQHFTVRDFNKPICQYCLCNSKVWERI